MNNIDLTPTEIALELSQKIGKKISNRKVNLALAALGFQKKRKISKGKSRWQLSDRGKDYGRIYFVNSLNSTWSGNQIKWNEKVIDLIETNLLTITS